MVTATSSTVTGTAQSTSPEKSAASCTWIRWSCQTSRPSWPVVCQSGWSSTEPPVAAPEPLTFASRVRLSDTAGERVLTWVVPSRWTRR